MVTRKNRTNTMSSAALIVSYRQGPMGLVHRRWLDGSPLKVSRATSQCV